MAGALVDALLGSTTEVLVEKAINLASEQIGQFVGFKKDLEKLQKTLTGIQAVLLDAEKKQVTEDSVKLWLEELERVAFDAENLLDVSNPIAFRCRMAKKIQKINMDLTSIHERRTKLGLQSQNGARDAPALSPSSGEAFMKDRETDSVTIGASFVGRDDDVSSIVTQLTATSNNETLSVHPIVGLGGIGKTTVAQKAFNDLNIKNHFDKRMWVCVSDVGKHFDANKLFGLMLEKLGVPMAEVAGMDSREAKVQKLKEMLDGEERNGKKPPKYLLVLDDVWNEDPAPWNRFLDSLRGISSAKGSWILVTTRNEQVATITTISSRPCSLEKLSDHNCWLILEKTAFGSRETPDDLKELGLELAKKCQGLPLAATCFAYCSIFPQWGCHTQDFQMERNQLIQLWAAEGFLHPNPRNKLSIEEVGNRYFTILLDSNLFQDAEKDDYGNVLNCKMHDLVHDMVQSISNSKALRLIESGSVLMETSSIRYLALERSEKEMPFPSIESFKCVTTLFLQGNRSLNDREMSFLMLRVLNLRASSVQELPKSIGKLTHLRYLDSSITSIKTLPGSLCQLYNLQTLRVKYCDSLTKFPKNFKNLVNLRHFEFFSYHKSSDIMPFEIGQLQFLQTLPFFNIGEERGQQIGELRNLKNLSGQLELRNLELVKSKEEAESANLIGKPNIDELRLLWNEIDNSRNNDSEYNQVLEGLHPHPNLKGLIIERFFGDQLSKWIGELGRLVKFKLQNCKNCKELPSLGYMPFLRSLHLDGLDSLTSIGPSFYVLFPALEHLILEKMQNLSEWMEATVHDGTVVVFPLLYEISITDCPQLATFPSHFPCLKILNISKTQNGSTIMGSICSGVSTLTELSIQSVEGLTKLPNVLFQNNPNFAYLELRNCGDLAQFLDFSVDSLEILIVENCPSLESISIPKGRKYLTALRQLSICSCDGLTHLSIPQISESDLDIFFCPNLISFPIDLTQTPSLYWLYISNCEKLTDLPKGKLCSLTSLKYLTIGPFSKATTELHSFLDLFDALPSPHPYFPSLSHLRLFGWPHWESLPKKLQHLSALTNLRLIGFGVKSLPDWFGKLSSLEDLYLWDCEKLENLPSHQSMRSLTRLTQLRITNCPLLKEKCNPNSSSSSTNPNSEWSKISHIRSIEID
ncbi:unnamed protein product [Coffea canephora]|uniref:Disease resistance protein RGA3 n=1 Tax=Coffea canephora TaxID=49390 RepID=A0A068U736_COFCA|nr:unnamed protein product [Coffea canephora]